MSKGAGFFGRIFFNQRLSLSVNARTLSLMAEDRYKMTNRKARMSRRLAAWKQEFEKEAEAMNAKGKYLCVDCDRYHSLIHFEYEHEGETKVARRCKACRDYRYTHRGNKR